MLELFIAAWLTITPPSFLITDSTEVWLAEFQITVDDSYLLNKDNFCINDGQDTLNIYSATLLSSIDNIPITYTKVVAFQVDRATYRKVYTFTAAGYGTKYFFNNGYATNLETKPKLIIKSP